MDRWAGADPEYDRPDGLTSGVQRPIYKWIGLLVAWVLVAGLLSILHLGVLVWVIMIALIGYVVYSILRDTPSLRAAPRREETLRTTRPRREQATFDISDADDDGLEQFNPPPGWPLPPPGWTPPPGWQPNPSWPPAPAGWQFWLPPARRAFDERTARAERYRRYDSESDGDDNWPTNRWR